MRPRVLLYNPSAVFWTLPLALIALGSAVDRERFDVQIVDGRLETDPVATMVERARGALCVGITVLTGAPILDALRVTRALRAACPGVAIVWGGWHPSLFPEACLREAAVDAVVVGQGEVAFQALLTRLAEGASLDGIPGVARLAPDGAYLPAPPHALTELAGLPAHRYEQVPVERYFAHKRARQLDYVSSVGCRFRCAFCADPEVYARGWSGLPADRIVDELSGLTRRYGVGEISFQDETFFTLRPRVTEMAQGLLQAGVNVRWQATLRADQGGRLGDDELALLKASGLFKVMVGVDAGTDAQLARVKKDLTVDQVRRLAHRLDRLGIGAVFNFIVGYPDEEREDFEGALALARELRALNPRFEISTFFFRPYPGTVLARALEGRFAFPDSLEAWARFDYVGAAGPWVGADQVERVRRFQFYSRVGYGDHGFPGAGLLRRIARWRVTREEYRLPVEERVAGWLKPGPPLS